MLNITGDHNRTVVVQPVPVPPYIIIFLQFRGPPDDIYAMIDRIHREKGDILLSATQSSQFMRYSNLLEPLGISFRLTNCIDYLDVNSIAANTWMGAIPLFTYVHTFPLIVWFCIYLSIIALSVVSSLQLFPRFDKIHEFLWNYYIIMFSKNIQIFFTNRKLRPVLSLWLMASTLLSTLFTAILLEHMVSSVPALYIDSLEQLSERPGIQAVARSDGSLVEYIATVKTSVTKAIDDRLITFINFEDIRQLVIDGLRNGSVAFVHNKRTLLIISMRESGIYGKWSEDILNYRHNDVIDGSIEHIMFSDQIIDNRTLLIQPIDSPPFCILSDAIRESVYEMCGPLVELIISFAKSYQSYVKFMAKTESIEEMILGVMEKKTNILMTPLVASEYIEYSTQLREFDFYFRHSDCIDYYEMAAFVSLSTIGDGRTHFTYFRCFSPGVWLCAVLSIWVLSLVSSRNICHESHTFFWHYFTIMFIKSMPLFIQRSNQRFIISVWLVSALVLSTCFTTYLLDHMSSAAPVMTIDTLDALSRRPDMKIVVRNESSLAQYSRLYDTELAANIRQNLRPYMDYEEVRDELIVGLRNGSMAYANARLTIIFDLMQMTRLDTSPEANRTKLIDVMHIADDSEGLEPYFLFVTEESEDWVHKGLNRVHHPIVRPKPMYRSTHSVFSRLGLRSSVVVVVVPIVAVKCADQWRRLSSQTGGQLMAMSSAVCGLRRARMASLGLEKTYQPFVGIKPYFQRTDKDRNTAHNEMLGSGIICHTNGFVLTTAGVVANYSQVMVHRLNAKDGYISHVVFVSLADNLALIKLPADKLSPEWVCNINAIDDRSLKVGHKVRAVTNPRHGVHTHVTDGVISCPRRKGDLVNGGEWIDANKYYLQHTCAVKLQDMGCPLLNAEEGHEGDLIAMNCFQHKVHINVGIAVNDLKTFLDKQEVRQLLSGTHKWTFGLEVQPGGAGGLQVTKSHQSEVSAGSVISHVNGYRVTTIDDIIALTENQVWVQLTIGTDKKDITRQILPIN
ncbi:unnamed protein product [Medioppia subpectinata]|uniref:Uncharacterized protein n=1 Tax=Medioppia subpectinata TaxID=1979941 RepID=A0A7R9PXI9_9ACAR|nr:unnamed protein product [Medioppia subpectinata]CAG2104431.1 unnamed protein product [Medioppia subpectinata]